MAASSGLPALPMRRSTAWRSASRDATGTISFITADRLTRPQVRRYLLEGGQKGKGEKWNELVEVDWDIALDIAARRLRETRDTHGSNSIGVLTSAKCLNEENYLMNKFARQVIGTNNIDHCARL